MGSRCNGKTTFRRTVCIVVSSLIVLMAMALIGVTETGIIPPVKVGFYCGDPSLSHKNNGETVTPLSLGVSSNLIFIIIILGTEMLRHKSLRRNAFTDCLYIFREGMTGATLTLFITSIAKILLGEHRPHFFETCQPDTAMNCTEGAFVEDFACTTTKKFSSYVIADSSLSFPSGHSSVSWFLGVYLSYVVQERLPPYMGYLMKPFLISICLTYSMVCSLSRITDRQHHWWDVLAGSMLGILVALNSIRLIHQCLRRIEERRNSQNNVLAKPSSYDRDDQMSNEELI